jgi:hypothetical protein
VKRKKAIIYDQTQWKKTGKKQLENTQNKKGKPGEVKHIKYNIPKANGDKV